MLAEGGGAMKTAAQTHTHTQFYASCEAQRRGCAQDGERGMSNGSVGRKYTSGLLAAWKPSLIVAYMSGTKIPCPAPLNRTEGDGELSGDDDCCCCC